MADAALFAEGRHPTVKTPRNAQIYFSCLDYLKLQRVILPKFKGKLHPGYYVYNETTKCITITRGKGRGNKIFLLSQEAGRDSYESFSANRFYVDEEHEEDIFVAILARCIDYSASILMAATPEEGLTWLWHRYWKPYREGKLRGELYIVDGKDGKIQLSTLDNPTLDEGEVMRTYARMAASDPLMAKIRIFGEPLNLSGTPYFNMEVIEKLMQIAAATDHEVGEFMEVA